jgi:hypothetical protein
MLSHFSIYPYNRTCRACSDQNFNVDSSGNVVKDLKRRKNDYCPCTDHISWVRDHWPGMQRLNFLTCVRDVLSEPTNRVYLFILFMLLLITNWINHVRVVWIVFQAHRSELLAGAIFFQKLLEKKSASTMLNRSCQRIFFERYITQSEGTAKNRSIEVTESKTRPGSIQLNVTHNDRIRWYHEAAHEKRESVSR